jgi:hypothetical protein
LQNSKSKIAQPSLNIVKQSLPLLVLHEAPYYEFVIMGIFDWAAKLDMIIPLYG